MQLTVGTSRVLSAASPGYAQRLADDRARIVLAPGLLERARAGDRGAQHVVLHELAHVILHHDVGDDTGRDCEAEADAFAAAVLALIRE